MLGKVCWKAAKAKPGDPTESRHGWRYLCCKRGKTFWSVVIVVLHRTTADCNIFFLDSDNEAGARSSDATRRSVFSPSPSIGLTTCVLEAADRLIQAAMGLGRPYLMQWNPKAPLSIPRDGQSQNSRMQGQVQ